MALHKLHDLSALQFSDLCGGGKNGAYFIDLLGLHKLTHMANVCKGDYHYFVFTIIIWLIDISFPHNV